MPMESEMRNETRTMITLRPKVHFTPEKGWMNDPNGLVFYKGKYHLFYQHDPDSLVWNIMHWGHAVSDDLLSWEHLPIALYPDELGVIYSGCGFVDTENASGLGSKEDPALLLFYTSHDMETKKEQQCLAWTLDGMTFHKYEGNPILPGAEHTPARDPQVFRNTVLGGYTLILTREDRVEFYGSHDLLHWKKSGEFFLPEYALSGMIECPCMFRAEVEEGPLSEEERLLSGEEKKGKKSAAESDLYILILSMDVPESEFSKFPEEAVPHARVMQYFVGTFDGKKFIVEEEQKEVKLVDHGPDFYAGTIFSNVPDTILLSWLGDFSEGAKMTPTEREGFRGIQCYPRKLTLRKTKDGWRLRQVLFPEPEEGSSKYDFRKNGDEQVLIDGCVREVRRKDGLWISTSIFDPNREHLDQEYPDRK